MRVRLLVLCALVAIAGTSGAQTITTFTVTNFGASAYRVTEMGTTNNPTLQLVRGRTYTFNVTALGHPFFITTVANNAVAAPFTTGVTGNMVENGTLTFAVPSSAPNTLFYQCSFHNPMSGMLQISSPPVPALGLGGVAALGGALLMLGMALRRRRAR